MEQAKGNPAQTCNAPLAASRSCEWKELIGKFAVMNSLEKNIPPSERRAAGAHQLSRNGRLMLTRKKI
jgi:hypothetical protein